MLFFLALLGGAYLLFANSSKAGVLSNESHPRGLSMADVAASEAEKWRGLTETTRAGTALVQKYWSALRQSQPVSVAWSAAFISWVAETSNTQGALEPHESHMAYAKAAALNNGVRGKYGAFRPYERPLKVGDIVLRERAGSHVNFDDLLQSGGAFKPTHGDIVVATHPGAFGGTVEAVGGNVDNAVTRRSFAVDDGGYIRDPSVFAVLRLQA